MTTGTRQQKGFFQNIFAVASDLRFLQIFGQIVFIILVVVAVTSLANSIVGALASKNLTPTFTFLQNRAGFAISGAEGYTPDDSFWVAYTVGLRNTLVVVAGGLVGATVLGIIGGVFLLSTNWLIRTITRFFVEILRNTPLLLQIFAWYFVAVLALPSLNDAFNLPNPGLVALPLRWLIYLIVGVVVWRSQRNLRAEQREGRAYLVPLLVGLAAAIEVGFAFFSTTSDYNLFGVGLSGGSSQVLYVVASVVIFAIVYFAAPGHLRASLGGLVIGQLLGALAFFFAVSPDAAVTTELHPILNLSNRGLVYPEIHTTAHFAEWFLFVVIGITVAVALYFYLGRLTEQTGDPHPRVRYGLASIILFAVIGWLVVAAEPLPTTILIDQGGTVTTMTLDDARAQGLLSASDLLQYSADPVIIALPERAGLRFSTGTLLDQRYIALLLALVTYTAAFIAEIVRAGIQAVPNGQLEAARALGLKSGQTLYMVILPQALRVIIPPLGNQYLNLAKNSSLALAIAYSDIYAVMYTVINQSGQAVTGILIIMFSYLVISLAIAGVMNWVNGRFQLVTR